MTSADDGPHPKYTELLLDGLKERGVVATFFVTGENGYHLFAVDGSRIELPNSQSTFDFFGEMSSFPDPDRRYTMALASIIYDVLDD